MTYQQNKCSGFTGLSTHFSTSYFVDNVYNSVYNSIFSHFPLFSMWITFTFTHLILIIFFAPDCSFGYFVHPCFFTGLVSKYLWNFYNIFTYLTRPAHLKS